MVNTFLLRWFPLRASVLLLLAGLLPSVATAQNPVKAVPADTKRQGTVTLTRTVYNGRVGFRLSNGETEAVIVPSLGRVMRYGFVGGTNWLWNAPSVNLNDAPVNWGGDKSVKVLAGSTKIESWELRTFPDR